MPHESRTNPARYEGKRVLPMQTIKTDSLARCFLLKINSLRNSGCCIFGRFAGAKGGNCVA